MSPHEENIKNLFENSDFQYALSLKNAEINPFELFGNKCVYYNFPTWIKKYPMPFSFCIQDECPITPEDRKNLQRMIERAINLTNNNTYFTYTSFASGLLLTDLSILYTLIKNHKKQLLTFNIIDPAYNSLKMEQGSVLFKNSHLELSSRLNHTFNTYRIFMALSLLKYLNTGLEPNLYIYNDESELTKKCKEDCNARSDFIVGIDYGIPGYHSTGKLATLATHGLKPGGHIVSCMDFDMPNKDPFLRKCVIVCKSNSNKNESNDCSQLIELLKGEPGASDTEKWNIIEAENSFLTGLSSDSE